MNEAQIEIAARQLCKIRGIDPDERVMHGADPNPDGTVYAIALYSPAWTRAAREIEYQQQILEAYDLAKKQES